MGQHHRDALAAGGAVDPGAPGVHREAADQGRPQARSARLHQLAATVLHHHADRGAVGQRVHERGVVAQPVRRGGPGRRDDDAGQDPDELSHLLKEIRTTTEETGEAVRLVARIHSKLPYINLEEMMRQIAELKLAGCSTQEIAQQLELSPRTVERKTGLIRRYWTAWLERTEQA